MTHIQQPRNATDSGSTPPAQNCHNVSNMDNSTDSAQPSVFFSFLGSRDPFHSPENSPQGPLLDLWQFLSQEAHQRTWQEVVVAYTPGAANGVGNQVKWSGGYDQQAETLKTWFTQQHPDVPFRLVKLKSQKPNDPRELLPDIVSILGKYRRSGVPLHINVSSGTPQMLELLKSLRVTGWFGPQTMLWQIDGLEHRQAGKAHVHEAVTPYMAEALQLESAFGAMRRFDFAGARDDFATLARYPLEIPERQESVSALADVADILLLLDERDYTEAAQMLSDLPFHIPPLQPLKDLLEEAKTSGPDALVWLTWGRYDRAATQERQADALIWAVILQEMMIAQLLDRYGISLEQNRKLSRASLGEKKFNTLKREVPGRFQGDVLKIGNTGEMLEVLAAPSLMGEGAVKPFHTQHNAALDKVRSLRNRVAHQGIQAKADEVDWKTLDKVVEGLLQAYPFEKQWAKSWVNDAAQCPVSASALIALTDDLQDWLD